MMSGSSSRPENSLIAYLDCASGISGDKFLASCLDAGASLDEVRAAIDALDVGAVLHTTEVRRGGLRGLSVRVTGPESPPHRTWSDIRALIESANLSARVGGGALAAFRLLAEAEAAVHGTTIDDVSFHEVGATDAIADIVGGVAAFVSLGVGLLVCSPIAVGSGVVDASHGVLPVPAPATLELLRDVPVISGQGNGELTTPTGAALVRALTDEFGGFPAMRPAVIGCGAGSRETAMPNVARLVLGHPIPAPQREPIEPLGTEPLARLVAEEAVLLVTNIDHITPEHASFACEELTAEGALDTWLTPIAMKKGRLAIELHVLAGPPDASRLAARIADLTGTLGVRVEPAPRLVAERQSREVDTSLGRIRVKVGPFPTPAVRPEHDDVARIARATGMRYDEIARTLADEARESLSAEGALDDE